MRLGAGVEPEPALLVRRVGNVAPIGVGVGLKHVEVPTVFRDIRRLGRVGIIDCVLKFHIRTVEPCVVESRGSCELLRR